jgi:NAD(P)-dependent dehydrogenase (short-subunit alcohol dehydrogenase family)
MTLELEVVTGGGAGLGRIIVGRLAGQGAHVVIADPDREAGSVVADEVQQTGGRATFVQTDMSEEKEVRQLIQRVAGLGPLSVLVNNAGGWLPGPQFPDTEDWSRSLDLNLRMPMLATQLALPVAGSWRRSSQHLLGWRLGLGPVRVSGVWGGQGRLDPLHHGSVRLRRPLRGAGELHRAALDLGCRGLLPSTSG